MASLRRLALAGVLLSMPLLLGGCAAALEAGLAEEAAFSAARLGAVEGLAARGAVAGFAEEASLAARAGATEAFAGRLALGEALTEARVAAIAGRSGLGGVLEELSASRTTATIDAAGRISVGGETILSSNSARLIRVPSTGEVIGRLQGTRLVQLDSVGSVTGEVGDFFVDTRELTGSTPLKVTRVRPGWYRVVVGQQGAWVPGAVALLAAGSRDEKRDELRENASAALAAIRSFRSRD